MISKTFDIDLSQTQECNFSFIRGDTFTLTVNVKNNGVVFDLTGYSVILSAMLDETGTSADIQLTGSDITVVNAEGKITCSFSPTDTMNATAGMYFYDIQIESTTQKYTIIKSKFELIQDVTKGTDMTTQYKTYNLLITQSGTSAPTVTLLENTLGGTPVWSYNSLGTFLATGTGLFDRVVIPAYLQNFVDSNGVAYRVSKVSNDVIKVQTLDNGQLANGLLTNFPIELKVY